MLLVQRAQQGQETIVIRNPDVEVCKRAATAAASGVVEHYLKSLAGGATFEETTDPVKYLIDLTEIFMKVRQGPTIEQRGI